MFLQQKFWKALTVIVNDWYKAIVKTVWLWLWVWTFCICLVGSAGLWPVAGPHQNYSMKEQPEHWRMTHDWENNSKCWACSLFGERMLVHCKIQAIDLTSYSYWHPMLPCSIGHDGYTSVPHTVVSHVGLDSCLLANLLHHARKHRLADWGITIHTLSCRGLNTVEGILGRWKRYNVIPLGHW